MQPFSPDIRNIGGRSIIANHMYNHLISIESAQSALKKLLKPTQPAIKRKPSPLYKLYQHFQQVLNTFQKVQQIKEKRSSVDKFKHNYYIPSKKVLSQNNNEEYVKNYKKRIEAFRTIQHRKKNKQDYLVYPSFFFRRVDKSQLRMINNTSPSMPKPNTSSHQRIQKQMTIQSKQDDIDWHKISQEIPQYDPQNIKEFQQRIIEIIYQNRLYSDDDYAFLICLISSVNMHVSQNDILEAFQLVLKEIES